MVVLKVREDGCSGWAPRGIQQAWGCRRSLEDPLERVRGREGGRVPASLPSCVDRLPLPPAGVSWAVGRPSVRACGCTPRGPAVGRLPGDHVTMVTAAHFKNKCGSRGPVAFPCSDPVVLADVGLGQAGDSAPRSSSSLRAHRTGCLLQKSGEEAKGPWGQPVLLGLGPSQVSWPPWLGHSLL